MMLYYRIPLMPYIIFLAMMATMISLTQAQEVVSSSTVIIKNIIHIFALLISPFTPFCASYFTSLKYNRNLHQCLGMEPLLITIPRFLQEYL